MVVGFQYLQHVRGRANHRGAVPSLSIFSTRIWLAGSPISGAALCARYGRSAITLSSILSEAKDLSILFSLNTEMLRVAQHDTFEFFGGLSAHSDESPFDAGTAPFERWLDQALIIGHGAVLRCLKHYNEAAQVGLDKEINTAFEKFGEAWGKGCGHDQSAFD